MNVDRFVCAALFLLGSAAVHGKDTLETTFRTNGPRMHQLLGEGPTKDALQHSSAVIQRGREELAYGVVVSADGYILTKASEVPDVNGISVVIDQQTYPRVQLLGTDPRWDVALLKVEATALIPARLSTSSEPERGTWVVANGSTTRRDRNPQVGVISATAREVKEKNSIGGLALKEDDGALQVSDLSDDGDAKKAGLVIGDVILTVEDHPVKDAASLMELLQGRPAGQTVSLSVKREDQTLVINAPLSDRMTGNDRMNGDNRSVRRSGFPRVIQHDVIADRERMGGPVVDLDGTCVGMNIARADRCETYAIPAQELKALAEEMIAKFK